MIKKVKRFYKKFPSLKQELIDFNEQIITNPEVGTLITTHLNNNVYKIRLGSKSKGKGKSGGFRIITYLVNETEKGTEINLITIYDKSEESCLNKSQIIKLLKELF